MAHASNLSTLDQDGIRKDLCIELDDQWTSWVAISGGLGLLLSVHLQTPTPSFHIKISTSGQLYNIVPYVDEVSSPRDYLESIYKTHQGAIALPGSLQEFSLCTDIPTSVSTSTSASGSGSGTTQRALVSRRISSAQLTRRKAPLR